MHFDLKTMAAHPLSLPTDYCAPQHFTAGQAGLRVCKAPPPAPPHCAGQQHLPKHPRLPLREAHAVALLLVMFYPRQAPSWSPAPLLSIGLRPHWPFAAVHQGGHSCPGWQGLPAEHPSCPSRLPHTRWQCMAARGTSAATTAQAAPLSCAAVGPPPQSCSAQSCCHFWVQLPKVTTPSHPCHLPGAMPGGPPSCFWV